jgi:Molecular chaperone (small heat shock protein)
MDDFFNRLLWAPDMTGSRSFRDFDLYEEDGKLHFSIEAPGINPDDLEVKIAKDNLSIRSKSENEASEENVEDAKTWYNKKSVSVFNYQVSLPFEIDTGKAEATFENGMISVTAPRLQASESKVLSLKKG